MSELKEIIVKGYCPNCESYEDGILKEKKITTVVRDVAVKAVIHELYCVKCNELLSSDEVERSNDIAVFDAYKKNVGLLTSEDIKRIRNKRNMSQAKLAKFLEIGEKDITRYENGAIQTKNIDNQIRMIDDDIVFERMCQLFKKNLNLLLTN